MASRQTANKKFERKCEICGRSNRNERILGPLIHTQTISAHYNCVLFSPVTVDAISIASKSEDDGICGVTARFIRSEGNRAKKLKCNYCKCNGAHTGCCFDIGTDSVLKFCPKRYHADCGVGAGASLIVSKGRGTVSLCFEHRDPIERTDEQRNLSLPARETSDDSLSNIEEYDVDEEAIGPIEPIEVGRDVAADAENLEIAEDLLGDEDTQAEYLEEEYQVEIQNAQPVESIDSATVKDEPFNMETIHTSLDNTGGSDCMVVSAYFVEFEAEKSVKE